MAAPKLPFLKSYVCPACAKEFPNLDKLNFHLSFACSSRSSSPAEAVRNQKSVFKDDDGKKQDDSEDVIVFMDDSVQEEGTGEERLSLRSEKALALVLRKKPKPETVKCPGCSRDIAVADLDFHLDHACVSRAPRLRPEVGPETNRKPPGLVLLENFITEEEEALLIETLERTNDWKPSKRNGKCDTKHWGVVIDYSTAKIRTRLPDPSLGEKEMPEFLQFVIERFAKYPPLSAWWPNEANANRYIKSEGHYLTPHFDDRQLSGEIICNISLCSACVMTFAKPGSVAEPFRVRLPRLCASVMSRSARYDFTHAISNEDLLGEKRISLNFRQQAAPLTDPGRALPRKQE